MRIERVRDWERMRSSLCDMGSWRWRWNLVGLLRRLELLRSERGCLAVRGAIVD